MYIALYLAHLTMWTASYTVVLVIISSTLHCLIMHQSLSIAYSYTLPVHKYYGVGRSMHVRNRSWTSVHTSILSIFGLLYAHKQHSSCLTPTCLNITTTRVSTGIIGHISASYMLATYLYNNISLSRVYAMASELCMPIFCHYTKYS